MLVGERLATSPGALAAAADLAAATGARLAWVPRRAGERGALEAGALGALLPGGRPVSDASARAEVARGVGRRRGSRPRRPATRPASSRPLPPARSTRSSSVVSTRPTCGDPAAAAALETAFVVSLELRESPVTAVADVVLPVAPQSEKTGTYVNWEGRVRAFEEALDDQRGQRPPRPRHARERDGRLPRDPHPARDPRPVRGPRPVGRRPRHERSRRPARRRGAPTAAATSSCRAGPRCSTPAACRTASRSSPAPRRSPWPVCPQPRPPGSGLGDGDHVTVSGPAGSVTLPAVVTEGMVDGVVWVPTNAKDCSVRSGLGTDAGGRVPSRRVVRHEPRPDRIRGGSQRCP